MQHKLPLDISLEVENALQTNLPVVALESTIITHGMEYPINVETALAVEKCIRDNGAIPATIAIVKGRIKVGLSQDQIEDIGKNRHLYQINKINFIFSFQYIKVQKMFKKRSIHNHFIIGFRQHNSCYNHDVCSLGWYKYFRHWWNWRCSSRGNKLILYQNVYILQKAELNFDISADLLELGKTPVAVVSAGAKSILDIPKTLEYLETQGVPVIGYKTKKFPEFFTSDSGELCSDQVNSPEEAASIILTQFDVLNLQTGILIANPIPIEEEANGQKVKASINQVLSDNNILFYYQALQEANENKVQGAEITPFLLKRVNDLTEGDSSRSNIALILNNAKVGAQIAAQMTKMRQKKFD